MEILEVKSNERYLTGLTELLVKVVDEGASIGFLPPLGKSEAAAYWSGVKQSDEEILFAALIDDKVVGTVQLHLCTKPNGSHRAEIAKLMTDRTIRRKGLGRLLMKTAEERAQKENRRLLVLDTREGDPSNHLYQSMGYTAAGKIPNFAQSANGQLDATIFYYKNI